MSKAIQKVMLEYVIPHLAQDEIEELKAELVKLSSSAATPKPREWRHYDVVRHPQGSRYIRVWSTRGDDLYHWQPLSGTGLILPDTVMPAQATWLFNLADLLAQGDVLVAFRDYEADAMCDIHDWMKMGPARAKVQAALAARNAT